MNLISKYNIPAPRYTSYPTVPYWENNLSVETWKNCVRNSFNADGKKNGISVYIHLPYCSQLCTYCGCNTRITVNHNVEIPYIKSVLKEWSLYLDLFDGKPVIKELHLGGGTPTFFSHGSLAMLMEGILSRSGVHPTAKFSFEAHPNSTTKEHLAVLSGYGFRRISIGVQDFDQDVLDIINRTQSYGQVVEVTRNARAIGYSSVNYDIVHGLPLQTKQKMKYLMEKVIELKPDRIAFYSYAHVPWVKPGQRKYSDDDLPDGEEKRKLYETGKAMLEGAGYYEIGMDHFALPSDDLYKAMQKKSLHRNFMGYTPDYTQLVIGLGASSIGDTWNAFAQNFKGTDDYLSAIAQNEFPFLRGHLLDSEDLILRRHILNIMCKSETNWENEKDIPCIGNAIGRLKELADDGLVTIFENKISIPPASKPFLRNICMAFDERLWRKQPQTQIFSKVI